MSSSEGLTYFHLDQGDFIVDRRYTNLKLIGDGCSGLVCSADDTKTNTKVAIKKISNIFRDIGEAKRILREMKLLRHFSAHENIVTINDVMTYPADAVDFRDVYIVTSLMESTMHNVIASGQPLSGQHHQYFLYQVLRGLKYIHSASVLHRDLKPSNLLVNANCDLAICDFGLARGVELGGESSLSEYVVTRWYRAPELLCNSSCYGKEVDIWSVGCIFAEMLGRRPFLQGKDPIHQLKCIMAKLGVPTDEDLQSFRSCPALETVLTLAKLQKMAPPAPPLYSYFSPDTDPEAIDLLSKMLQFNPQKRISVGDALEHPYLHVLHSEMLHAEPECDMIFDCEFEKRYFGPKQRNIPLHELHIMMYREMLSYRPSPSGEIRLEAYKSQLARTQPALQYAIQQLYPFDYGYRHYNGNNVLYGINDYGSSGDKSCGRYHNAANMAALNESEYADCDWNAFLALSATGSDAASDIAVSPGMFAAL